MTVANKNEIKGFKQGKKEIKKQYDTYFLKKKKKKKIPSGKHMRH